MSVRNTTLQGPPVAPAEAGARVDGRGRECLAPHAAVAFFRAAGVRVRREALWAWRTACPWQERRKGLDVVPFREPSGREQGHYVKAQLAEALAAMTRRDKVPELEGLTYFPDAVRALGVCRETAWQELRAVGAAKVKRPGADGEGRPCRRTYVETKHVRAALSAREGRRGAVTPDTMSVAVAAVELGSDERFVRWLVYRKKLTKVPDRRARADGVCVYRDEVQELKSRMRDERLKKGRALDKGWKTGTELAERYGRAPWGRGKLGVDRGHVFNRLSRWKKDGLLRRGDHYEELRYVPDSPDGMLCFYDPKRTDALLRGPAEGGAAEAGTPAAPAAVNAPAAGASGAAPKGGRPRDPETEAVYRFCFECYSRGDKLSATRSAAARRFGGRAPKEDATVRLYARRYAEARGLPLRRPGRENP
jgi:hypothetical protein